MSRPENCLAQVFFCAFSQYFQTKAWMNSGHNLFLQFLANSVFTNATVSRRILAVQNREWVNENNFYLFFFGSEIIRRHAQLHDETEVQQ